MASQAPMNVRTRLALQVGALVGVSAGAMAAIFIAAFYNTLQDRLLDATTVAAAAVAALAAAGALVGVGVANTWLGPVQMLREGTQRLRQGEPMQPVALPGGAELQALAQGFNTMSAAVQQRETAMQMALAQAREINRHKSEFLANVSHELRTPLNAIINVPIGLCRDYQTQMAWHCPQCGADFALDTEAPHPAEGATETCPDCSHAMTVELRAFYHGDASTHYHYLQRLLHSARHLLAMVTDILDFSKLEAGKMTIRAAAQPVKPLLADVQETVELLATNKKISLVWPHIDAEPTVWADGVKLSQVILNLLANAIKFTPEGGRVEVTFKEESGQNRALFTVQDNGIGIAAEKISTLFESFRQVDASQVRAHRGTGLGLAISRKLIDLHGGIIWCESELGKGSRFCFTVPLTPATHITDGKSYQGRVLVVDDDSAHLEMMENCLRDQGYETECLHNTYDADAKMQDGGFDAVILDIMAPERIGLTWLKNLKDSDTTKHIPVIVSSALMNNKDLVVSLGGIWLPKPWSRDDLVACVHATLASKNKAPAGSEDAHAS